METGSNKVEAEKMLLRPEIKRKKEQRKIEDQKKGLLRKKTIKTGPETSMQGIVWTIQPENKITKHGSEK